MNICYYATGKRKTSIARVFGILGNGLIIINKKILSKYFNNKHLYNKLYAPLILCDLLNKFDFYITVKGGGFNGQIEAIRHGISKFIIIYNIDYKKKLKTCGFLTRDSRIVERKKVGLKKSRKAPQYSKR